MIFFLKSEKQTLDFARRFASQLRGGEIVALVGELGAGKTTFVRGLASYFGIREPVRSPTFTLMLVHAIKNEKKKSGKFQTKHKVEKRQTVNWLVHVDAYRLKNRRELDAIGFGEYAGRPDTVTFVEWAERVGLDRTADYILRFYHAKNPAERRLEIKKRPDAMVGARDA